MNNLFNIDNKEQSKVFINTKEFNKSSYVLCNPLRIEKVKSVLNCYGDTVYHLYSINSESERRILVVSEPQYYILISKSKDLVNKVLKINKCEKLEFNNRSLYKFDFEVNEINSEEDTCENKISKYNK